MVMVGFIPLLVIGLLFTWQGGLVSSFVEIEETATFPKAVSQLSSCEDNSAVVGLRLKETIETLFGFDEAELEHFMAALEVMISNNNHETATNSERNRCETPSACFMEAYSTIHVLGSRSGFLPVGLSPWFRRGHVRCEDDSCGTSGDENRKVVAKVHPDTIDFVPDGLEYAADRHQMGHFMKMISTSLKDVSNPDYSVGTRCLQWDDVWYLDKFFDRLCTHKDFVVYKKESRMSEEVQSLSEDGRGPSSTAYHTDILLEVNTESGIISNETFDLIIFEQVLEHVRDPFTAMEAVFRITKPGGLVIWGAPHISIHHPDPTDFWRFTVQGAELLANHAGFIIRQIYAPGNERLLSGEFQGIHVDYWTTEEILTEAEGGYLGNWGLWNSQTHMLLEKPKQELGEFSSSPS
uniref:Methyltransferase type 11 domain-containing protein n=1 Tax=Heterosigma akashiwo TaxID=2829 RepID=A0A6V1PHZ3_HETAK